MTALPTILRRLLTLRTGEPGGRSCGGTKERFDFDAAEGHAVLREKCLRKLAAVCTVLEATNKPRIFVRGTGDIYFKRAKHDSQDQYVKLSDDNFIESLTRRWTRHTQSTTGNDPLDFEFFLYVDTETQSTTSGRMEDARIRRLAHQAANHVTFGEITGQHLDVVNARLPDGSAFVVPTIDNTTQKAIALDTELATLRATASQPIVEATAIIDLKQNGVWIPRAIRVSQLRAALGLPQHNIFTEGIYHRDALNALNAINPTYGDQADVDPKVTNSKLCW